MHFILYKAYSHIARLRSAIGRAPDSEVRGPGFETRSGNILSFLLLLFQEGQLSVCQYVHEVLVNRLGGLSLPRKSVVRLTDHPDMTLDVYHGRKTTIQQQQQQLFTYRITRQVVPCPPLKKCPWPWAEGHWALWGVTLQNFGSISNFSKSIEKIPYMV